METSAAMHERFDRAEGVAGSSDRNFGLTFAAVGAIVALWPLLGGEPPRWWLIGTAVALVAVSLFAASILSPFNRLWLRFGLLLHRIVNPVVLGVVFYGVLTPLAFVLRAAGKDSLRLKVDRAAASYWIARDPPGPTPKSMNRQF